MVVEAGGLDRVRTKGTFEALQRYWAMSQEGLEIGQEPLRSSCPIFGKMTLMVGLENGLEGTAME